jgi:hypothetical protein
MSILRIYAKKDCSISDVIEPNLLTRTDLSNDGAADSLQIFSVYNRLRTENIDDNEKSRILIYFDIEEMSEKISSLRNDISKKYFLRLFHVDHLETTPSDFTIIVNPLTSSFTEGFGLDQDNYTDKTECNWIYRTNGVSWTTAGGDYDTDYEVEQYFETGLENLEIDITDIVEAWIDNTIPNHGLIIRLKSDYEDSSESYYKKKFSSRTTEFWFSKPTLECVYYDDTNSDDLFVFRSDDSYEFTSSLKYENIKFGNKIDCDSTNDLLVNFYTSSIMSGTQFSVTGSRISSGTYFAEFSYDGSEDYIYYKFTSSDESKTYKQGSLPILNYDDYYTSDKYIVNINNLKKSYSQNEIAKMNLFIKSRTNQQNYYTKYIETNRTMIFNDLYFKLRRVVDDLVIFDFDHENDGTKLQWDKSGNYLTLDMSLLEKNYMYELSFYSKNMLKKEFEEKFKFRVT